MLSAWSTLEGNPPLYFVVAWPWAKCSAPARPACVALGAARDGADPVVYLCGRELVSRRAGLVAAALAAVNPFMIWYSQEAREYMLLAALSRRLAAVLRRGALAGEPASRRRTLALVDAVLGAGAADPVLRRLPGRAPEAVLLALPARSRGAVVAWRSAGGARAGADPPRHSRTSPTSSSVIDLPAGDSDPAGPGRLRAQHPVPELDRHLRADRAAVLAAVVIALLVAGAAGGAAGRAARGGALAGGGAAHSVAAGADGHDDYVARGLIPAWIPLAVVVARGLHGRRTRACRRALRWPCLLAVFV